jgi:hypothetical protein
MLNNWLMRDYVIDVIVIQNTLQKAKKVYSMELKDNGTRKNE